MDKGDMVQSVIGGPWEFVCTKCFMAKHRFMLNL